MRTINSIIEYLRQTRLVADNRTTMITQGIAGQVVRAIQPPAGGAPQPSAGGGGLKLYVVVAAPNGGAGTGTVAEIGLNADGTWTATTTTATKVFPELG